MAIVVGNIARGENFFGREEELADLWRYLEENHVALAGPRRLGKSSLLVRLSEEAEGKGVFARLVDVEGLDSAAGFVTALEQAYPDEGLSRHVSTLRQGVNKAFAVFKKVEFKGPGGIGGGIEFQPLPDRPWAQDAGKLEQRLYDKQVLLLVDEFSVFLEKLIAKHPDDVEPFLGWLRRWRLGAGGCRFVFAGSIGINALLERHRMSTWLNDCHPYELPPFRLGLAKRMLIHLAGQEGWTLSEQLAQLLCEKTGWLSPFYLNLLLDEATKAGRDRLLEDTSSDPDSAKKTLQEQDISDAYDRLLAKRSRFIHWYQRLSRDLSPPEEAFALPILRYVAKAQEAVSRKQILARLTKQEADPEARAERLSGVLAYLQENGYLGEDREGRLAFLSFLLRDYWKRNHGL